MERERISDYEARGIGGSALRRECHSQRKDQGNAWEEREKEGEDNMRSESWGDVRGRISWGFPKSPCTRHQTS